MAPHYVRFARSLALLGGLGAAGTGCGSTNTPDDAFSASSPDATSLDAFASTTDDAFVSTTDDAFVSTTDDAYVSTTDAYVASTDDAYVAPNDAGPVEPDAFDLCATCTCTGGLARFDAGADAGLPACETTPGAGICCAAIGPLSPPDLAV